MITVNIRETDEFIKLGQALKKAGLVESGVDAKFFIQDGQSFSVEKNYTMEMLFPLTARQFRL